MTSPVRVREVLEIAGHDLEWLQHSLADPEVASSSKEHLRTMIDILDSAACRLEHLKPEDPVDSYLQSLKRRYKALKLSHTIFPEVMEMGSIRNVIWQVASWKVAVCQNDGRALKHEPYPQPVKLSYTKKTLLGVPLEQFQQMTFPATEINSSATIPLQKEMEALAPNLSSVFRGIVERAPNLPDLERSLKFTLRWFKPISERAEDKVKRLLKGRKINVKDLIKDLKPGAQSQILDPIESQIHQMVGPTRIFLSQLLAFKQYVKLNQ